MARRWFKAAVTLIVGTALVAGCDSGSGSADGKVTITFWDNNAGPSQTPIWEHIIAEFEAANPNIDVKYVGIPIAQVQQKYDTAIAGGGLPDVGGVSTAMLSNLVPRKALEAVDDRIAGGALNGKIIPQVLSTVRATVPDGKTYLVPTATGMGIYWYRTDWFSDAGLTVPRTWDEFFAAVSKLTDKSKNRNGFTIRGGAGSIAQMFEAVYGQSGITEMFDASGKSTINDPGNVAALERIVGLYKKYTPEADLNNDYVKMVAQFDGGSIGIMQHNLASYADHTKALGKDKVAAFAVPKSAAGNHVVVSNPVSGLGVFSSGKNKDAAFKFAEFTSSKASDSYLAEKTGALPANSDVISESWLTGQQHIGEALRVLSDPATKVVQLPYYLPEFNGLTKAETEPLFQKVLLGQLSSKDFLDQFAAKFTEAQAKYKQRNGG